MAPEVISSQSTADVKLPDALTPLIERPNWVIWRWVTLKTGKRTKVPYQARYPNRQAKSDDPSTWATFDEAAAAAKSADGIGFVCTDTDITAFDLDDCRNAQTKVIHPWVSDLIARANSYAEITPSNEGLRIIGYGKGNQVHREFPGVISDMGECALYRKATRYITITGNQIGDAQLTNIDAVIDATLAELEERKRKLAQERKLNGPGSPEDGGHFARQDDEEDLDTLIRTGGNVPVKERSERVYNTNPQ